MSVLLRDGFALPGLYVIVDDATLRARGVELRGFAEELRGAGVSLLQWRCKGGPQEVLAGAAVLREVFEGSGCRLMMNDRVDLAVLAGFDGVHVGQGDLGVADCRRVMPGGVVGISTHTGAEVREAEGTGADYVAVGPVFATGTKPDASPVVGLEGVRRARGLTERPLVAIGGITLENVGSVWAAGADAVAVVSGLLVEGRGVGEVARQFLRLGRYTLRGSEWRR